MPAKLLAQKPLHAKPAAPHHALGNEDVLEAVQKRLDENPQAMRTRRETSEQPFGTIKMRVGTTHFLMKTLPKVATETALCVLTYNLARVLNIVGVPAVLEAIGISTGTHVVTPGVHETAQDRPPGTFRMPSQQNFSNWASRATLAGARSPGSDLSTRPRPKGDIGDANLQ